MRTRKFSTTFTETLLLLEGSGASVLAPLSDVYFFKYVISIGVDVPQIPIGGLPTLSL